MTYLKPRQAATHLPSQKFLPPRQKHIIGVDLGGAITGLVRLSSEAEGYRIDRLKTVKRDWLPHKPASKLKYIGHKTRKDPTAFISMEQYLTAIAQQVIGLTDSTANNIIVIGICEKNRHFIAQLQRQLSQLPQLNYQIQCTHENYTTRQAENAAQVTLFQSLPAHTSEHAIAALFIAMRSLRPSILLFSGQAGKATIGEILQQSRLRPVVSGKPAP